MLKKNRTAILVAGKYNGHESSVLNNLRKLRSVMRYDLFFLYWTEDSDAIKQTMAKLQPHIPKETSLCFIPCDVESVPYPAQFSELLEIDPKGFRNFFKYNHLLLLGAKTICNFEKKKNYRFDYILHFRPDFYLGAWIKPNPKKTIFVDELQYLSDNFKLSDKMALGPRDSMITRLYSLDRWFENFNQRLEYIKSCNWKDIPAEERYLKQFVLENRIPFSRSSYLSILANNGQSPKMRITLSQLKTMILRIFYPNYKLPKNKR